MLEIRIGNFEANRFIQIWHDVEIILKKVLLVNNKIRNGKIIFINRTIV